MVSHPPARPGEIAHTVAPAEPIRPEPAATSDPEPSALPEIHVKHDRKVHHEPGSSELEAPAGASVVGPRTVTAMPEGVETTDAAPGPVSSRLQARAVAAPAGAPAATVQATPRAVKPVMVADVQDTPEPLALEPMLYRSGRLIVPPALKGSHEILVHQNAMADQEGLERVRDDDHLERMRAARQLVALPASDGLVVDERLPFNRRYCRPWTAQFLVALSRAHYARFHTPLQVNSAVRTVEFQQRLMLTNGNAAPPAGETASPHLTGQAVDLAKHGLSMTEIAWLRGYLLPLVQQGKVDVEEEFQQSCFHISVYKNYLPETAPQREIPARRSVASSLAAAMR